MSRNCIETNGDHIIAKHDGLYVISSFLVDTDAIKGKVGIGEDICLPVRLVEHHKLANGVCYVLITTVMDELNPEPKDIHIMYSGPLRKGEKFYMTLKKC